MSRIALMPREATIAVGDTVRSPSRSAEMERCSKRPLLLAITEAARRGAEIVGWDRTAGTLLEGRNLALLD